VVTLGPSAAVDVGALSALFRDTTNSYKYLFFLALLRCLKPWNQVESRVPLRDVIIEVLALAWYPHTLFRLSFGATDQVGKIVDTLSARLGPEKLGFSSTGVARLRADLSKAVSPDEYRALTRYVPFRLLVPFFQPELAGVPERRKEAELARLARREFGASKPLYRMDGHALLLHPDWATYLSENRSLAEGWAAWHWLGYMQDRNPNVPNLAGKLFPEVSRSPLTKQLAYWKAAARAEPFCCIYSGELLTRSGELLTHVELDHYVPWSFVLHDRIWNLVPVTPRANSCKGDHLAASDYLDKLIDQQCQALIASRQHLARRAWERFAEEFEQDLRVPSEVIRADPPDREALRRSLDDAYRKTIPALENLATRQGFSSNWTHSRQASGGSQLPP
jgi:hypothetical protein